MSNALHLGGGTPKANTWFMGNVGDKEPPGVSPQYVLDDAGSELPMRMSVNQNSTAVVASSGGQVVVYDVGRSGQLWSAQQQGNVQIAEMVFNSQVLLEVQRNVAKGMRWTVRVVRMETGEHGKGVATTVAQLDFGVPVKQVLANAKRLVVVTAARDDGRMHVYEMHTLRLLHVVCVHAPDCATVSPEIGLAALSPADSSLLAYSVGAGAEVHLFDALRLLPLGPLPLALDAPARCLAFSPDGRMLLAADVAGKLLPLICVAGRVPRKVAEFKCGTRGRSITSLAFSPDSLRFAAASRSGTVHIFDIPDVVKDVISRLSSGAADDVPDVAPSPDQSSYLMRFVWNSWNPTKSIPEVTTGGGLCAFPNDSSVLVCIRASGVIYSIDLTTPTPSPINRGNLHDVLSS